MEFINDIWSIVVNDISWAIVVLVLVLGELTKRYWVSDKLNSYFKVLIVTVPFVIIYSYFKELDAAKVILSYPLAFWLYPLIIKGILKRLGVMVIK